MIYDVIIVGAGASGLFAAASFENKINGLVLNNSRLSGIKLLMSGTGQCNFTKSGDIKNFIRHYGNNGLKIRKPLYKFSNQALIDYFEENNIPTFEREDGKMFPKSLTSKDIFDLLLLKLHQNGFSIKNSQCVVNIISNDGLFKLETEDGNIYDCSNLIIATGGSSYPNTGSNGSMLPVFSSLDLKIVPPSPCLVPVFVENYGFEKLSGISFPNATVSISGHSTNGGLLLTHNSFSGPAILDASRYARPVEILQLNYLSDIEPVHFLNDLKALISSSQKQIATVLNDCLNKLEENVPKRFLEVICRMSDIDPTAKASGISGEQLKSLVSRLTKDSYKISGTAGYSLAMCTSGGVSLDEINLNTFETKKYPHLYIVGEALDVDGDTGGYNIQFAFSSGYLCAKEISSALAE